MIHTEFAALLRRANITQNAFAELCGVTPQGVNNWVRGRSDPSKWAVVVAIALVIVEPDELAWMHSSLKFSWSETLGVADPARVSAATLRKQLAALAKRHHPDVGGSTAAMQTVNAAYEAGMKDLAQRAPRR